jgi:hypothetical protein
VGLLVFSLGKVPSGHLATVMVQKHDIFRDCVILLLYEGISIIFWTDLVKILNLTTKCM